MQHDTARGAADFGAVEIKDLPRHKLLEILDKLIPMLMEQYGVYRVLTDRIDIAGALLAKGRAEDARKVLDATTQIWRTGDRLQ